RLRDARVDWSGADGETERDQWTEVGGRFAHRLRHHRLQAEARAERNLGAGGQDGAPGDLDVGAARLTVDRVLASHPVRGAEARAVEPADARADPGRHHAEPEHPGAHPPAPRGPLLAARQAVVIEAARELR